MILFDDDPTDDLQRRRRRLQAGRALSRVADETEDDDDDDEDGQRLHAALVRHEVQEGAEKRASLAEIALSIFFLILALNP